MKHNLNPLAPRQTLKYLALHSLFFCALAMNQGVVAQETILGTDGDDTIVLNAAPQGDSLVVNTGDGADLLIVDFSQVNPIPAGGLFYDGGNLATGDNALLIQGGRFEQITANTAGPNAGTIIFDNSQLVYTNLTPITDTAPAANYTFNVFGGQLVQVVNGPISGGVQTNTISSTDLPPGFETTDYGNKGDVTVNIGVPNVAVTLDVTVLEDGFLSFSLNGSAGQNTSLIANASSNYWQITGMQSGNITGPMGNANVPFTNIVGITGSGASDTLDLSGMVGSIEATFTSALSGNIAGVMSFQQIGNYIGTPQDDIFIVDADGAFINLNGGGGLNTLKINSPFTLAGSITNMNEIDVAGTFNIAENILTINSSGPIAYLNEPGGILSMGVSPNATGEIVANFSQPGMVNLAAGSFIAPQVTGTLSDSVGTFDIITTSNLGAIFDASTIIQPLDSPYFFAKRVVSNGTVLQLFFRDSFSQISTTPWTQGVAGVLDIFSMPGGTTNLAYLELINQLTLLGNQEAIEIAMESLVPAYNHSLPQTSYANMYGVFENIREHMLFVFQDFTAQGLNFGDQPDRPIGAWIDVIGTHLNQNKRDNVAGYKANATGVVFGVDAELNDFASVGLAASYASAQVYDKSVNPKDQVIHSFQGSAYGWFNLTPHLFLDAIFGIASNQYDTSRVVHANQINDIAVAQFDGTQYGVQADLGWAFTYEKCAYIAPLVRIKYVHLDLDDYTENGADDFGLTVSNHDLNEFIGSIGVILGANIKYGHTRYMPEITALIGNAFTNDAEQTVAGFVGGGPAFATPGVEPGRTVFDFNAGMNALVSPKMQISMNYNGQWRADYWANSVNAQYFIHWA